MRVSLCTRSLFVCPSPEWMVHNSEAIISVFFSPRCRDETTVGRTRVIDGMKVESVVVAGTVFKSRMGIKDFS